MELPLRYLLQTQLGGGGGGGEDEEGAFIRRGCLNKGAFIDNLYLLGGRSFEGDVYSKHYGTRFC